MIKAIIFDLNGIFIQSPKLSERFQEKFGISSAEFLDALNKIMPKLRRPNAGDAFTYWNPYFGKWGLKLTREQFFNFWFNTEKKVPELVELVKQIKEKGIKLFILSNNFAERANYYKKNFPFLRETFDKVYYSWQTGFVKPDLQAFRNLLSEQKLEPEECIYFDNSKENIEAGKSLGIKSFIFEDIKGFKKNMAELIKI